MAKANYIIFWASGLEDQIEISAVNKFKKALLEVCCQTENFVSEHIWNRKKRAICKRHYSICTKDFVS